MKVCSDDGMVEMPMNKLISICSEIYQAGTSGCNDLRESVIEEVLARNGVSLADSWKVFTVKELAKIAVGTVFIHSVHGRCWVSERPEEQIRFMCFLHRGPVDFRSDTDPWDKPMKIIG